MNPFAIISKHYDPATPLYMLLVTHSVLVAGKAHRLGRAYRKRHPEARIDLDFVTEAALLHDIGIGRCHCPEILCSGQEAYIRHGILGREILEAAGLPRHALVCERHTGAGIPREEVETQGLPLPDRDYLPLSTEEKIICVADKYFSKSPRKLWKEKSPAKIEKAMAKYGPSSLARWKALLREVSGA